MDATPDGRALWGDEDGLVGFGEERAPVRGVAIGEVLFSLLVFQDAPLDGEGGTGEFPFFR